jgi:D-2-hydroxyacid dehydrogenase (NADP+)
MSLTVIMYCQFWNRFWSLPAEEVEKLRATKPEVQFINVSSSEELRETLSGAEVFFGYRLTAEEIQQADKLRWIHVPAANVYGLDMPLLAKRGIFLTNSRGIHATSIAEHVIGSMLVFSRRYMDCWNYKQQQHYAQVDILNHPPPLSELRDKTIGILGLGEIGREIARLAKAFGMRVLAMKRTVSGKSVPNVDILYTHAELNKILPESDYVVISMARTSETEGLLGEPELALLKPSSVLINIARASIVDQGAMIRLLKEERIRGAALDVFEKEPLPSDSELYKLPNVFLTPHVAGVSTREHWPRLMNLFAENLGRYQEGKRLINVVDLRAGY